jgi:hypothetical protein
LIILILIKIHNFLKIFGQSQDFNELNFDCRYYFDLFIKKPGCLAGLPDDLLGVLPGDLFD